MLILKHSLHRQKSALEAESLLRYLLNEIKPIVANTSKSILVQALTYEEMIRILLYTIPNKISNDKDFSDEILLTICQAVDRTLYEHYVLLVKACENHLSDDLKIHLKNLSSISLEMSIYRNDRLRADDQDFNELFSSTHLTQWSQLFETIDILNFDTSHLPKYLVYVRDNVEERLYRDLKSHLINEIKLRFQKTSARKQLIIKFKYLLREFVISKSDLISEILNEL